MGTAGKIFAALNEVKANPDVYAKGEFQKFTEKVIHLQKKSLIEIKYLYIYSTTKSMPPKRSTMPDSRSSREPSLSSTPTTLTPPRPV